MMEHYLAGGGLRLAQTIIYASMWIATGCFIAAVFRRMMGPEKVRSLFANDSRWGLLSGWLIGMLLPVCSLGVIPVVREMHRAGVKKGTILAFGLTAPLFNPMSVLYGLTLSDPIAILSFSLCALTIVSVLGVAWNRISDDPDPSQAEALPAVGIKRSVSVFYTAAKEMIGPSLVYILIGIVGSVTLATLIPKGYLQHQVEHDNVIAPLAVAFIAAPIYSTPLLVMSQIGGMFQHGNSIGAAFSLLILGAGTNLGLFCWFGKTYGARNVFLFFLLLLATTIGLAYLIDKPLYPKGIEPAGHSHAFDVYSNPFDSSQENLYEATNRLVSDFWAANEFGGTYALVGLIVLGLHFLVIERFVDLESWFCRANDKGSSVDVVLPSWVLGLTVVLGLVTASVVGCYVYYPAADDLLGDLRNVHSDAVITAKTGDWEAAEKWVEYSDNLSRRLEVGVFLREGSVGEFRSTKAKDYRERLEGLRMAVQAKDQPQVEEIWFELEQSYRRMSSAFRGE